MNQLTVIPSLSGLFGYCKRNNVIPQDTPNTIYAFGSTREGVAQTLEFYPLSSEMLVPVLEMLDRAEGQGRNSWRVGSCLSHEFLETRKAFLVHHITSRGGVIDMEWSDGQRHAPDLLHNATWNIPALQQFLENCVSGLDIRVLDYNGITTVSGWRT